MKSVCLLLLLLFFAALAPAVSAQQQPKSTPQEWKAVEGAMNRPGELQPDGAFKFSMPRKV